MRPSKKLKLRWRELQMIVRGLISTKHVLLAHIIPTRKCNLANGYLLTPKKILALNEAGLDHLQISIDNIQPDDVSMKSLKVLDKKLENLAQFAEFAVNINSVIGSGIRNPEDAVTITRRALQLGFASSLGIIHDGGGSMKPLN